LIADNELMFMVKAGDVEKLGVLFERYKKPLYGFFYRNLRNPSVCEDLVQNVFVRLLKYRASFIGNGKFTTWMFQIAHNVFMDHCSKSKRYQSIDEFNEETFMAEQELTDSVIKEEQIKLLNEALNRLSPEKKEILILSKYQGMKYKEIGEILSCSENTVKVRIFRALNELKTIYTELEGLTV